MFLSSTDSSAIFPYNSGYEFQVELPSTLHLEGVWTCALREITFTDPLSDDVIVFCDLLQSSFIRNAQLPVLRILPVTGEKHYIFTDPIQMQLSRDEIKRIRIFIRTTEMSIPSFIQNPVRCTLQLKRK